MAVASSNPWPAAEQVVHDITPIVVNYVVDVVAVEIPFGGGHRRGTTIARLSECDR